ncbi:hypothetical protein GGR53DRAFT_498287 [Hypoxylon sp. FL1150]|nr:hypothetical protein GGR53DRAFT_498287 [Hypoxylon sp. FL1150]
MLHLSFLIFIFIFILHAYLLKNLLHWQTDLQRRHVDTSNALLHILISKYAKIIHQWKPRIPFINLSERLPGLQP